MDIDGALKSFGLHSVGCCDDCRRAADQERAARASAESDNNGAPDHIRKAILAGHDKRIAEHERMLVAHARRAAYAEEGFLIDGPDERTDLDHVRQYSGLQASMHSAGRVRHFQAYDDDEGDIGDEGSA